jgi:hypothetical protein
MIDALSVNTGRLIRWGGAVLIVRYVYLSVSVLSGKTTAADILVRLLANSNVQISISWALAASGLSGWLVERRLRKRTIQKLAPRIKYLERLIDEGRSSSNLMEDGSTRPEDDE